MSKIKTYVIHNLILVAWFVGVAFLYFYFSQAMVKHITVFLGISGFFAINYFYHQSRAKMNLTIFLEYFLVGVLVFLMYLVVAL